MNEKEERQKKLDEFHREVIYMTKGVDDRNYSKVFKFMEDSFEEIPIQIVDEDGDVIFDFMEELKSL